MTDLDSNSGATRRAAVLSWISVLTTAVAVVETVVLAVLGDSGAAVVAGVVGGLGAAGTVHVTINIGSRSDPLG